MLKRQITKSPYSFVHLNHTLGSILGLLSILVAGGCLSNTSGVPDNRQPPAYTDRLIIKLKSNTLECSANGMSELAGATNAQIEFLRAMSSGLCLIQLTAQDQSGLSQAEDRIRQHSAIEWLEQDRKMKAFGN